MLSDDRTLPLSPPFSDLGWLGLMVRSLKLAAGGDSCALPSSAGWERMVIVRVFDGTNGSAITDVKAVAKQLRIRRQIRAFGDTDGIGR
ncbi:hypothetical protein ACQR07_10355 [Bradyrhizobium sp. HKCCYLS20291]